MSQYLEEIKEKFADIWHHVSHGITFEAYNKLDEPTKKRVDELLREVNSPVPGENTYDS